ncbi:Protein disulfide-isomerase erp38 [Wickerhamiella sorbophila]|uniref:protein disulfide-isomerase n=1 Tax=Wickerhamiella sorbophila TaxID=45607 RepID=A0A2T0FGI5_9ASCO|nr:Protein disulfide-isomerase erp38 [Wickerhamiella sorbophila]PRT54101.1 Protein disulfide-isomerase erp38 [Wickerhamiella sorbophila]
MQLLKWLAVLPLSAAAVIEATDVDLDKLMSNGVPTILDIYASWCGHCKTFSPVFDEVAALYEHAKDKIQFVKIDGDIHRKAAKKHDVKFFPTIKFVDGDKQEDINSRDAKSLHKLIKSKTGAEPQKAEPKQAKEEKKEKKVRTPKSKIVSLTDDTFEDAVDDKDALVAFTTTWCGYCKRLKPVWDELAALYEQDDEIVVAEVDCTDSEPVANLMETFHVEGYPTIVYFPKDGSTPRPYTSGRDIKALVKFMKDEGISFRNADGQLDDHAGVVDALTEQAQSLIGASQEAYDGFIMAIETSGTPFADVYTRVAKKVFEKGASYVSEESARIEKLLATKLAPKKADKLRVKLNVLRTFVAKDTGKDEL